MFWIGLLVGVTIMIILLIVCAIFALKFFGVTFNEWCELTETLEGVGNRRESEIIVVYNKDTEWEYTDSIELKKQ